MAKKVSKTKKTKKKAVKKSKTKKTPTKKKVAPKKKASKPKTKKKSKPSSSPKSKSSSSKAVKQSPKEASAGTRAIPKVGDRAPFFSATDDGGRIIALNDFKGFKNIVLYFYPKDDTPGCTVEACAFQEHSPNYDQHDTVVLGVSGDSLSSHQKFKGKFGLRFPLLVDENFEIAQAYGAYGEKNMYGKKYLGIIRSTFVINKDGIIAAVWPNVKVDGHAADVLSVLKNL